MVSPPMPIRKPRKRLKPTHLPLLFLLVPVYLLVGNAAGESRLFAKEEPVPPPERTRFVFQNQGPDADFTFRYVAKLPGAPETLPGALTSAHHITRGSAIEEQLERGFPKGTTFSILGERSPAASGETEELGPLEVTIGDPHATIVFIYGFDSETRQGGLIQKLPSSSPRD